MYCTRCGQPIEDDTPACRSCGQDVSNLIAAKQELLRKRDRNGLAGPPQGRYQPPPQPQPGPSGDRLDGSPPPVGGQAGWQGDPYAAPAPPRYPGYGYPLYPGQDPFAKRTNPLGLWAGIVGIAAVVGWVVLFVGAGVASMGKGGPTQGVLLAIGFLAILLALASLGGGVVGIVALTRANAPKGMAWVGMVANGLSVLLFLLALAAGMAQR